MAKAQNKGQLSTASRDQTSAYTVWGLTGGIAAGKSTAARIFAEAGVPVLDADEISRQLSAEGGAGHLAILQRFKTTDRFELRRLVFSDPLARRDLEAILHPLIQTESLRRMSSMPAGPIIYEAALLVETGRYKTLAGLIVIEAPRSERERRLIARDQIDRALASRMIDSQISDQQRREAATTVIDNSEGEAQLRDEIQRFIAERLYKTKPVS